LRIRSRARFIRRGRGKRGQGRRGSRCARRRARVRKRGIASTAVLMPVTVSRRDGLWHSRGSGRLLTKEDFR